MLGEKVVKSGADTPGWGKGKNTYRISAENFSLIYFFLHQAFPFKTLFLGCKEYEIESFVIETTVCNSQAGGLPPQQRPPDFQN
jgi:hypothetical protein